MVSTTIDELYFHWLCKKVDVNFGQDTSKTYHGLFQILHEREFVWTPDAPNDKNRVRDGFDLRYRFRDDNGWESVEIDHPVSVLEVIIGLSIRVAFQADGREEFWAWQLIENLELHKMNDPITRRKRQTIDEKLEALMFRTYEPNGVGGFFPLAWPEKDQRKVELWYQMAAYVLEMHEP